MIGLSSFVLVASSGVGNGSGIFWSIVAMVVIGMGLLLVTPYRFVIGYFIAGMGYWLMIEGLQWLVTAMSALTGVTAYVIAIGLSLLPLMVAVNWQPRRRESITSSMMESLQTPATRVGIGHRPVVLARDTNYYQHYVRHASVTDNL